LQGVAQPPEFHPEGDVWTHTLLMLQALAETPPQLGKTRNAKVAPVSPELALGVLLHDIGKPATATYTDRVRFHNHARVGAEIAAQICLRLKFSTRAAEKIMTLVSEHEKMFEVERMRASTLKRFLRQEYIQDLLALHRLDCLSSRRDLRTYQFCQTKLAEFLQETMRPPRLISGDDLIRLGFTPGPVFKQVLEYIEDAQLEGIVTTRKKALALVQELQETIFQKE
jgi:poly(A) polymerase